MTTKKVPKKKNIKANPKTKSKKTTKIKTVNKEKKAADLKIDLEKMAAKENKHKDKRPILQRFFKTGKGEYGEGDVFIGLSVPATRKIAKRYYELKNSEIKKLLASKIHEVRLAALLVLVAKYEKAKDRDEKREIVGFYLQNSARVNSWDLVDLSVYKILGDFLLDEAPKKAKAILHKLADSKNMWERRMAMVSTFSFIKAGRKEEVVSVAKKLLHDGEDLIHKASGWMLREMGKRVGEKELREFLDMNYKDMSRTALRYAIEKFDDKKRKYYLKLKNLL